LDQHSPGNQVAAGVQKDYPTLITDQAAQRSALPARQDHLHPRVCSSMTRRAGPSEDMRRYGQRRHGRWRTHIVRANPELADKIGTAVTELGPSTARQIEAHLAAQPRGPRGSWWGSRTDRYSRRRVHLDP
jgi:hypothetical protein